MNQVQRLIQVNLILAVDESGVLGIKDGAMAWPSISEDFANFRNKTLSKIVVMGRKTWDSLPPKFRPLPGREANVVMTASRDKEFLDDLSAQNAVPCCDFKSLLSFCIAREKTEIWVIGGKEIYEKFLDPDGILGFKVTSIHRTLVNGSRACTEEGVSLPQEERQHFIRMPSMIDPINGYSNLELTYLECQIFPWGKIETFSKA